MCYVDGQKNKYSVLNILLPLLSETGSKNSLQSLFCSEHYAMYKVRKINNTTLSSGVTNRINNRDSGKKTFDYSWESKCLAKQRIVINAGNKIIYFSRVHYLPWHLEAISLVCNPRNKENNTWRHLVHRWGRTGSCCIRSPRCRGCPGNNRNHRCRNRCARRFSTGMGEL
jgi:hypothetical protein